ncbi:MAG: choice-of-anchor L domain-containing protein, partial [Flavobacteriales bacterium]
MTAAAQVQCGQTYHIKIAIADAGDTAFDSAVFLEGGSFSSNSASIEASASIGGAPVFLGDSVVVEGCNEAGFTVI